MSKITLVTGIWDIGRSNLTEVGQGRTNTIWTSLKNYWKLTVT